MMWIVYQTDDLTVVDKFYSKNSAKYCYRYELLHPDMYMLALESVDMLQFDKWKMWKTLQIEAVA